MSTLFLLGFGVVGPLAGAILAAFGGTRKSANTFVQSVFAVSSALGLIAAGSYLFSLLSGTVTPVLFGYAGIPFNFFVDQLAAFFLLLINLGTLLASLFAIGYLPKYEKVYAFPPLNVASGFFLFGMQAAVLAHSIVGFLIFWEVMSVAAYFLVIADREEASLTAGLTYFVMTHLGFVCLLAGLLVLAHGDPTLAFASLNAHADLPPVASALAFFLIFAGFGSKAGLVPLHQWLPQAHPQAPSHSSALMSGVMLKVAVYGFLRVTLTAFPTIPLAWGIAVVVIGLLSAFFGVLTAAVETDLKRMLAWSSIENLGLIFAMIGMGMVFTSLGMGGAPFYVAALFHALNHTIFKSGLFMAAGAVISETHTRDMDKMGGLANAWPQFSGAFLGLALAAAALPPFGTFYGEWVFVQSLVAGMLQTSSKVTIFSLGIVLSLTALVGGLAMFTFAKTFSAMFLSKPRSTHAEHVKPLSRLLVLPVVISAATSVVVGMFATSVAYWLGGIFTAHFAVVTSLGSSAGQSLRIGDGSVAPLAVLILAVVLALVVVLFRRFATNRRPIRMTDTWDCGQPLTARMEYTATGFAAPIRFFFRSLLLAEKDLASERVAPGNAWVLRRRLEWSTKSIWEEWLYAPITRAIEAGSLRVKKLQNGVIQFYILLILMTLVIVLVFAV